MFQPVCFHETIYDFISFCCHQSVSDNLVHLQWSTYSTLIDKTKFWRKHRFSDSILLDTEIWITVQFLAQTIMYTLIKEKVMFGFQKYQSFGL